jgi:hypothetical protein
MTIYNCEDLTQSIEITEKQHQLLINEDLIWYDGQKWMYSECKAFRDFLN